MNVGFVPVGHFFLYKDQRYQVVRAIDSHSCRFCAFRNSVVSCREASKLFGHCSAALRLDHIDVFIRKVSEKR